MRFNKLGRREFITLIGGAATWPLAAQAQQPTMPVVGFLSGRSLNDSASFVTAFLQGLAEAGYVEGRNVAIEYRWAEGQSDRLPALATELIRHPVAVIAAISTDAALAAKQATEQIPIVFMSGADPVKFGLVTGLAQPGGNATGVYMFLVGMVPKQFELLHELVPKTPIVGILVNPNSSPTEAVKRDVQAAARTIQQRILILNASSGCEIETVFANLTDQGVSALLVASDPFFNSRANQLAALVAQHSLAAIFPVRDYVAAGGLMSYGPSFGDVYHLIGTYAGRILKGEKPDDLPVQQSTKVEFVINLKTAKTLGLTFPNTLIGRADEVIE